MNTPKDKTLAIDLDGVIHRYSQGYKDGSLYDEPIPGAKDALANLVESGYFITIFTTRMNPMWGENDVAGQLAGILSWFEKHGFVKGTHWHHIETQGKPLAVAYIDDNAIHFDNWDQALDDLNVHLENDEEPETEYSADYPRGGMVEPYDIVAPNPADYGI